MLGIVVGQKTGTFLKYKNYKPELISEYKEWECISIILKNRTLDFASKTQSNLIDIWVGISRLIYDENPVRSTIPLNKHMFIVAIVKMKLQAEVIERDFFYNDFVLLGLLRSLSTMPNISNAMKLQI
jgi:hypothetical protein